VDWRRPGSGYMIVALPTEAHVADVLEEVTGSEITREHVVHRVDDWEARIGDLFSEIAQWLPPGWATTRPRTVSMNEPMMRHVGVAARQLPVLQISRDGSDIAQLEPRGLWILGTNGRLDLVGKTGHYLIIDDAEIFGRPDWRIAPLAARTQREKLDRTRLLAALS
jgi:hypothetical protein